MNTCPLEIGFNFCFINSFVLSFGMAVSKGFKCLKEHTCNTEKKDKKIFYFVCSIQKGIIYLH